MNAKRAKALRRLSKSIDAKPLEYVASNVDFEPEFDLFLVKKTLTLHEDTERAQYHRLKKAFS